MKRSLRILAAGTCAASLSMAPIAPAAWGASSEPSSPSSPSSPTSTAGTPSSSGSSGSAGKRKGACISERQPLATVTNGVSQAQRELDFTSLWDLTKGAGVTVGVIDSGINTGPAFGNRLLPGDDLVEPQPQNKMKGLFDCDGHGTLVAGIIGASPDRTSGFSGVAPESRIVSVRQSSALYEGRDGKEVAGDDKTLAQAIDIAVKHGVQVMNISTDSCNPASQADYPELTRAVRDATDKNVAVVVAAGNVGSDTCQNQNADGRPPVTKAQPADQPDALTVAALAGNGQASTFSLAGPWVKVAAPGEGIISTNPQWGKTGQVSTILTDQGPTPIAGTSFAAPYVAGVVALIRSRFPHLNARQVIHRVEATADHVDVRRRNTVGYGPVNPRRALTAVLPEEGRAGTPVALKTQETTMAAPRHKPQDLLARSLAGAVTALVALGLIFGGSMLAAQRRRERLAAMKTPRHRAVRRRRRRQRIPSA